MLLRFIFFVLLVFICVTTGYSISACQEINTSGTHLVTSNFTATQNSCLNIVSNDVELDCQGHTISGSNYYRTINLYNHDNVTIQNCRMSGFDDFPMDVRDSSNVLLQNLTLYDSNLNSDWGIRLFRNDNITARNLNLTDVAPSGDYAGIRFYSNTNITIENSYIGPDNIKAIEYTNNNDVIIRGNEFRGNNAFNSEGSLNGAQIYNNAFYGDVDILGSSITLNISNSSGPNIFGGPYIGGNYYGDLDSEGFSNQCSDNDNDGFCDQTFDVSGNGLIDYLPLTTQGQTLISSNISSCNNFYMSGSYTMNQSISDESSNFCIYIYTDDFELDCQGYNLDGTTSASYAFRSLGNDNISVKNCNVTDWRYQFQITSGDGIKIYNSTFNNDQTRQVIISGSSNVEVINNTFLGTPSQYPLYLASITNGLIYNNLFNTSSDVNLNSLTNVDFNITNSSGPNIFGGVNFGGNYWGSPSGDGFSDLCGDSNNDGFCDSSYDISSLGYFDYLPLTTQGQEDSRFNISSCKTLDYSGNYTVDDNISATKNNCIEVAQDNIQIDCQGFTIIGENRQSGIYVNNNDNITLKNCGLTDFSEIPLRVSNANNVFIENLDIWDSATSSYSYDHGVFFSTIENLTISDLNITNVAEQKVYGSLRFIGVSNFLIENSYVGPESVNRAFEYVNSINNGIIRNSEFRGNNAFRYDAFNENMDNITFYNNIFFGDFLISNSATNLFFNTSLISGQNIVEGTNLGGNYWGQPDYSGFSQTCEDSNDDLICDSGYDVDGSGFIDYLPLAAPIQAPIYIDPTPKNGLNKFNLTSFTINVSSQGEQIFSCDVEINGANQSMTQNGNYCNYVHNITMSDSVNSTSFKVWMNSSNVMFGLEERTISSYPFENSGVDVPAMGVGSLLVFLILILGGVFL